MMCWSIGWIKTCELYFMAVLFLGNFFKLLGLTFQLVGAHLSLSFFNLFYWLVDKLYVVKLSSDGCNWNSLMTSKHWFMQWLCAIKQQAITWVDVDPDLLSVVHNELMCAFHDSEKKRRKKITGRRKLNKPHPELPLMACDIKQTHVALFDRFFSVSFLWLLNWSAEFL